MLSKGYYKKMKIQHTERGKKIFANKAIDERLISKIHEHLTQIYIKKTQHNQKMGKRSKYTFFFQRRQTDG